MSASDVHTATTACDSVLVSIDDNMLHDRTSFRNHNEMVQRNARHCGRIFHFPVNKIDVTVHRSMDRWVDLSSGLRDPIGLL